MGTVPALKSVFPPKHWLLVSHTLLPFRGRILTICSEKHNLYYAPSILKVKLVSTVRCALLMCLHFTHRVIF